MPGNKVTKSGEKRVPSLKDITIGKILSKQGLFQEAITTNRLPKDLQVDVMRAALNQFRKEVIDNDLVKEFISKFDESGFDPNNTKFKVLTRLYLEWDGSSSKLKITAENDYMDSMGNNQVSFKADVEKVLNRFENVTANLHSSPQL